MRITILTFFFTLALGKSLSELQKVYVPDKRVGYLASAYQLDIELHEKVNQNFGKNKKAQRTEEYRFLVHHNLGSLVARYDKHKIFTKIDLTQNQFEKLKKVFNLISQFLSQCKKFDILKPTCDTYASEHFSDIDFNLDASSASKLTVSQVLAPPKVKRVILIEIVDCNLCLEGNYISKWVNSRSKI